MNITDIQTVTCEVMDVNPPIGGQWSRVTRYGPDNWTVTMGESDEEIYSEKLTGELEAAYQEAKKPAIVMYTPAEAIAMLYEQTPTRTMPDEVVVRLELLSRMTTLEMYALSLRLGYCSQAEHDEDVAKYNKYVKGDA